MIRSTYDCSVDNDIFEMAQPIGIEVDKPDALSVIANIINLCERLELDPVLEMQRLQIKLARRLY